MTEKRRLWAAKMKKLFTLLGGALLLAGCASNVSPTHTHFLPQPPPVNGHTKSLMQFTAEDLRLVYGSPAFVRKENGSEMWRYDVGACRIFFFLYRQDGTSGIRQYESIPPGAPGEMDRHCFDAFQLRVKRS